MHVIHGRFVHAEPRSNFPGGGGGEGGHLPFLPHVGYVIHVGSWSSYDVGEHANAIVTRHAQALDKHYLMRDYHEKKHFLNGPLLPS